MKAKGDYQAHVHSYQMVLVIVRQGGCKAKAKPRGTTGVKSTQIRWFSCSQAGEAGLLEQQPNYTREKPKTQGGLPGLSPLRSDGSRDSKARRLDLVSSCQRHSIETWQTTLGSQGTN
jgi:hypothetical protein